MRPSIFSIASALPILLYGECFNEQVFPQLDHVEYDVTVSGLYWRAEQAGMECAIHSALATPVTIATNPTLNNVVDAQFERPGKKWDFGFKFGVSRVGSCDGWDVSFLWTYFANMAQKHLDNTSFDTTTLLPLWSAYQAPIAGTAPVLFARDITSLWSLSLNLYDLELGRAFWTSECVFLRPFIGVRGALIDQDFDLTHRGGSWAIAGTGMFFNDFVSLVNDFMGLGPRTGLNGVWQFGCGWALYGDLSFNLLYGTIDVKHREWIRDVDPPFDKTKVYEAKESIPLSRSMLDLGVGLQWTGHFECVSWLLQFGWEQHIFFNLNQLWQIQRIGGINDFVVLNSSGENVFSQRRGNLSMEGVTVRATAGF